jgi:hypothetical protein
VSEECRNKIWLFFNFFYIDIVKILIDIIKKIT